MIWEGEPFLLAGSHGALKERYMKRFTPLILILGLSLAAQAGAATLDDLELRDHWMGDTWDRDALRDRTVVVEFWGYN